MKKLALACILLCAALATAQPPKWTDREAWRVKLQRNMTMQQVQLLLGAPVDREVSKIVQIWYYEKGPVREGGEVVKRPTTGIVRFGLIKADPFTRRRLPQPVFVVSRFSEPDWSNVPVQVFETRAESIRKKNQEAALERQQALERQKQEVARRREDLARQQQERLEATRKQRQEYNEKRRQEMQVRAERKKAPEPEEPKNYATIYYCVAGGLFIGAAAMIAVFKKDSV